MGLSFNPVYSEQFISLSWRGNLDDLPYRMPPVTKDFPRLNLFRELDLEADSHAPLDMVPCLLQAHYVKEHEDAEWLRGSNGTVMIYFSDWGVPDERGDLIIGSLQKQKQMNPGTHFGIPYPIMVEDKLEALKKFKPLPFKDRWFDLGFIGWNNKGWVEIGPGQSQRERLQAKALSWKNLQVDFELQLEFEGGLSFSQWLRRSAAWRCALVPPGLGPNSWRLSELLASGAFVIALSPIEKLDFDPPLLNGVHYVTCNETELEDVCRFWSARPEQQEQVARRAYEYAQKYILRAGWSQKLRQRLEHASQVYLYNRGIEIL